MTFLLFLSSLIVDVLCCPEPSPKEKTAVSPALGILFLVLRLLASLILQDYCGPIRDFSHLFCRMLLILPDSECSTSFLSCTFYYLHMFFCTCFLQLYHESPSAHLWLGLLIRYLSLSMLQSANSSISMIQIAHKALLGLLV